MDEGAQDRAAAVAPAAADHAPLPAEAGAAAAAAKPALVAIATSRPADPSKHKRRTMSLVRLLPPPEAREAEGRCSLARASAWRQARVSVLALGLALLTLPLLAVSEALFAAVLGLMRPVPARCWSLESDEQGISIAVGGVIGCTVSLWSASLAGANYNPRGRAFIPHCVFFGTAAGALSLVLERDGAPASFKVSTTLLYYICGSLFIFFLPHATLFAVKGWRGGLAYSRRNACKWFVSCIAISVLGCSIGLASFTYITVSTGLTGFAGFAVNGVLWPIFIQTLKHLSLTAVSSASKVENQEYIGMICLLVAVLNSTSQFYALLLIEEPVNFVASIISSALSELLGSWILLLRITDAKVKPVFEEAVASASSALVSWTAKRGSAREPSPPHVRPASGRSRASSALEGFAIKLAHEEVGEKVAIFLGGAVVRYARSDSDVLWQVLLAKIAAATLIECLADESKARIFDTAGIHIRSVGYHLHFRVVAAVLLMGTTAVICTLSAVRYQCLWSSA